VVTLAACVESIGVGLAPTANVRALVPARFVLAGDGQPVTPVVVRTSRCDGISVDGGEPEGGVIVQIGAILVPPDFTGDINNYTLDYITTNGALAERLSELGLGAQHVGSIHYDYDAATNALAVRVPGEARLPFVLTGTVTPSTAPSGSFVANWWHGVDGGALKLTTDVPLIDNGGASLTLTTDAGGPLALLFDATTVTFPILQQFNGFPSATMAASVLP
jgi:hypothetical protein